MARGESKKPTASPHSLEAEMAVIGAILSTPSCAFEHADKLVPEYFFLESHRVIVQSMVELMQESIPPDLINVHERLRFHGEHENVGDFDGLKKFLDCAANPENVGYWGLQVKQYWELRLVVEKCTELAARGSEIAGANVEAFLSEAEQTFARLAESRVTTGLVSSQDVVKDTMLQLEDILNNPGNTTGVPTGFVDLDDITSGFQPSDLIILAARPAMGKSSLALNFASHAAITRKKYVALFSLEMSNHQLMQRMLSTAAKVHTHKFRDGKLTADELNRLYPEVANFCTDTLMLDDSPGISIVDLQSRCRKMKREKGHLDMVIIDYLQLMTAGPAAKNISREREISIISWGLKALAKEMNCPVIALSQLNRGLEQRHGDKRPKPSDLRESGSIEQDADMILFIYRDEVYNKDSEEKGIAEIIIGKNRHGPMTTVKLAFHSEFTSFHNLQRSDRP